MLFAWTRTLHSCWEPWRPTAVIKRCKQTRVLQTRAPDVGRSLTELVLAVKIQFSGCQRRVLGGSMLIDLGSEVLALAPEALFRGCTLELVCRPLHITVVNGVRISGCTHGAVVELSVQIPADTFFLQCQRRHPELPKIPTYLPYLPGPQCADSRLSGSAGTGSLQKGVCVQGRCAGTLHCRLSLLQGLWPHGGPHAGSVG